MGNFITFLLDRRPLTEVSELFPREAMNQLFHREIDRAVQHTHDPAIIDDLRQLRAMDFVGYIDSALRRSGIPDEQRDEAVQRIVVRFLVTPGSLFRKWNGQTPMSARLKKSITNTVITMGQRAAKSRRRSRELPPDLASREEASKDDLIHAFRDWLRVRYGEPAVRVLDVRIANEDIKSLIGSEGIPSSYALKRIVQGIKAAAMGWTRSDPELNFLVQKMMGEEEKTLGRRFGRERAAMAD